MPDVLLIDAYSQIYRNFYGMPMLNNPAGEPVNALFGMARLLMTLHKSLPSPLGAVVFDKGKAARRLEICPEYKAQRPPMPPELRAQTAPIMEWMDAFGWPCLMEEGLEADDIIAAITRRCTDKTVMVLTSDKDIAQLTAQPGVSMLSAAKGEKLASSGREGVQERFGVPPELLGDFLALVGDTADNISGLPGIGPKTAAKLLNESGGMDALLENPSAYATPRIADTLRASGALIERNRRLVALDDRLPACWTGMDCIRRGEPDWTRLAALAERNGFKSMAPAFCKLRDEASQQTFAF